MTELERRALLGDQEAQKECTEQGIVLPCPICGKRLKKLNYGEWMRHEYSTDCILSGMEIAKSRWSAWNTRPAPPIGRCGTCKRRHLRRGRKFCEVNGIMQDDDYCSYYEPREGK